MPRPMLDLDDLMTGSPEEDAELADQGGHGAPVRKADMEWADKAARQKIDAYDQAARNSGVRAYDDFHTHGQDEYFGEPAPGLPDSVKEIAYQQELAPWRSSDRETIDNVKARYLDMHDDAAEMQDAFVASFGRHDPAAVRDASLAVLTQFEADGMTDPMRYARDHQDAFLERVADEIYRQQTYGGSYTGTGSGRTAGISGGGGRGGYGKPAEPEAGDMVKELEALQEKDGYYG